eukprot:472557_1
MRFTQNTYFILVLLAASINDSRCHKPGQYFDRYGFGLARPRMGAEQRIFDRRDENESVNTASETTTLSSEVEHAKDAMLHAVESAEKAAIHAIEDEVDLMFHSLSKHKEPAQSVKQQEQSG